MTHQNRRVVIEFTFTDTCRFNINLPQYIIDDGQIERTIRNIEIVEDTCNDQYERGIIRLDKRTWFVSNSEIGDNYFALESESKER